MLISLHTFLIIDCIRLLLIFDIADQFVLSLLSYDRLSKKPLLFKLFTGLTVQEFDDIYDKEITKRYNKYENKRLSKKKR